MLNDTSKKLGVGSIAALLIVTLPVVLDDAGRPGSPLSNLTEPLPKFVISISATVGGFRELPMDVSFLAASAARFRRQWAASLAGGLSSNRLSSTLSVCETPEETTVNGGDNAQLNSIRLRDFFLKRAETYFRVTSAGLQKLVNTSLLDLSRALDFPKFGSFFAGRAV